MLVCPQPHRQSFQSTLPYESDLNTQSNGGWISEISIHAPLRERLIIGVSSTAALAISIHAPLRERPFADTLPITSAVFQSTLPYGSDRCHLAKGYPRTVFQSTLPCGSDHCGRIAAIQKGTFQSTLPRGSDVLNE